MKRSMPPGDSPPDKVAIVYHFLAHYRAGVFRELLRSREHYYVLVTDKEDFTHSIRAWTVEDPSRLVPARYWPVWGAVIVQQGLLRLALRRDLRTIIYLGNACWPMTWASALLAKATGKRVLFWTHGWTHPDGLVKGWLRRTFYRIADGLLLYGHYAKMIGIQHGFPHERLYVIYNSLEYEDQKRAREQVTPERIDQLRRHLFAHPERPMLICTTRLTWVRRLDLLLQAMRLLKERGREVNLLLVGEGPERPALEQQAREYGLSVRFHGECYDEEVLAELVVSASATIAPGKVGLTAIHSLAFGTPVLTHGAADDQMPEWEAILPGETGDFFREHDVEDMARVIEQWTHQPLPSDQTRARCYELIERFYNPVFQRRAIDRAVSGEPADDLFWMKSPAAICPAHLHK